MSPFIKTGIIEVTLQKGSNKKLFINILKTYRSVLLVASFIDRVVGLKFETH